jgi:hypothetical protein
MSKNSALEFLSTLTEKLAAVEHRRWARWQKYMHNKCERRPDGSIVVPATLVERWERQIATSYADLDEGEKESDREQVREYLSIIANAMDQRCGHYELTPAIVNSEGQSRQDVDGERSYQT